VHGDSGPSELSREISLGLGNGLSALKRTVIWGILLEPVVGPRRHPERE